MSPRLVMESPCRSSSAFSRCSVVPEPTRTSPSSDTDRMPTSPSHTSCRSSGDPMPVKECPLPIGRTRRPAVAAAVRTAATSSAEVGRTTSATARWFPAQLRHRARSSGSAGPSVTRGPLRRIGRTLPARQRAGQLVDQPVTRPARCAVMSTLAIDPEKQRHRFDLATEDLDPPLALLDLDALDANADDLVRRASGKPIRVASKSVRSRDVLRRVLARPGFSGVLAYSLAEALWLATGDDPVSNDVVVAYPTADRRALRHLAADVRATDRITLMIDCL